MILVALGGFFGAISRFLCSLIRANTFPLGTWLANSIGSLLLGYLAAHTTNSTWLLLGVGFCGAFTTFSTFSYEVMQFMLAKQYKHAIFYSVASFGCALLAIYVGLQIP